MEILHSPKKRMRDRETTKETLEKGGTLRFVIALVEDTQKRIAFICPDDCEHGVEVENLLDMIGENMNAIFIGAGIVEIKFGATVDSRYGSGSCRDKYDYDQPENKQEGEEYLEELALALCPTREPEATSA